MSAPLLEFVGIEKAFFGVKVLRQITFSVPPDGAVGLVGENGAGKSTLMNILGGNLSADAGQMRFGGDNYKPATPMDAATRGIAFIHQELNLFPNLSIAENLFLSRLPTHRGLPLISRTNLRSRAIELLGEVGLKISPDRSLETLSTGERQLVEVAKALAIDARLIIFDEPTTSLTARESERLFGLIARLRARGIALIYISHNLNDVLRLCDHIVVLRDGQVVGDGPKAGFSHNKLVSLMVGREIDQVFPTRKPATLGPPILEARNLSARGKLNKVSFKLHAGEVLGLAGLMGAGRSEVARAIFGVDRYDSGEILVRNLALPEGSPRQAIHRGLAFLTENRGGEGLCLDASVTNNLSIVSLPKHVPVPFPGRLNFRSIETTVNQIRTVIRLDAKTSDHQPVRTLSGGNQQKVVLGKWLLNTPEILLLDEPTRGIDVGARVEIYQLIHHLAVDGAAVLIISSEIEELIGICDRILVLCRGAIVAEFPRSQFDREQILKAALGSSPK